MVKTWFFTAAALGAMLTFSQAQDKVTASNQTSDTDMIVGGWAANETDWPWQVRLYRGADDTAGFCGGSLISRKWVVTAAHCVEEAEEVQVGYGNINRTKHKRIGSAKVLVHENYDGGSQQNDIALIKLESPVELGNGTGTIDLATNQIYKEALDEKAVVTGWGQLLDSTKLQAKYPDGNYPFESVAPERLMEVDVRVQSLQKCRENYGENVAIPEGHLCAGYAAGGKDACQGDSGGPLVIRDEKNAKGWALLGIVSFGTGCALPKLYGAYTRVDYFRDWILSTLKSN